MLAATNALGYDLLEEIGSGSSAIVRLAMKRSDGQLLAIKIISKQNFQGVHSQEYSSLEKEIVIHGMVRRHENVIELMDVFEDQLNCYLVLEYAAGGELFNRIAPDIGIEEDLAHMYFVQLCAGMNGRKDYLHRIGISHRDLKPENLLLDEYGNLKISDFGLATVFVHEGRERILGTPCGTPPYVAPEIHQMKYNGAAVDIWSAGIILYVLLAGNTPWGEPTNHDEEFVCYKTQYPKITYEPWNRFSKPVLELLLGILCIDPSRRYNMKKICQNAWFNRPSPLLSEEGKCKNPVELAERMIDNLTKAGECIVNDQPISFTQPETMMTGGAILDPCTQSNLHAWSFSQPVAIRSFSQSASTGTHGFQISPNSQYQRPFRDLLPSESLTRFYSHENVFQILAALSHVLEQMLVPFKTHQKSNKISFNTVDKRKCPLHGDVVVQHVGEDLKLVYFRKSKGDPIEFKRFYKVILQNVSSIVIRN